MRSTLLAIGLILTGLCSSSVLAAETASAVAAAPAPSATAKAVVTDILSSGDSFVVPNFKDLVLTSIHLGAVDIKDQKVIDEYAKVAYCELYKEKFSNDFEWNQIRQQILSRVESRKESARTNFEIYGAVRLGRYSFETQDFPLTNESAIRVVGSMRLSAQGMAVIEKCGESPISGVFPEDFLFYFFQPLTFERVKMQPQAAQKLVVMMQQMENKDRVLYMRIRVRGLRADIQYDDYKRKRSAIHGDLIGIDLFFDREMTKFITRVQMI